jgi:hypothetical protein
LYFSWLEIYLKGREVGQGVFESDVDNTSAVTATGKNGANAIIANSDRGRAVRVTSDTNTGVESTGHIGVDAQTVAFAPPNQ